MPRNGCSKKRTEGGKNRFPHFSPRSGRSPRRRRMQMRRVVENVPNRKCQRERSRVEDTTIAATPALAECLKTWAPLLAQKLPIHSIGREEKCIRQRHLSIKVDKALVLHSICIDSIWRKRRHRAKIGSHFGVGGKKWAELRSARVRASSFDSFPPSRGHGRV